MGYRSLAMSTSERTHQIPVEKFERAESDYRMILADLEQFVSDGNRGYLPPVFAKVRCSVVVVPSFQIPAPCPSLALTTGRA